MNTKIDEFTDLVYKAEPSENTAGETLISLPFDEAMALMKELREVQLTANRIEYWEAEYAKWQSWLKAREKNEDGYWSRSGNEIDRAGHLLSHYEHQRDAALSKLGSFLEHAVISLRAIQMVVKQCHGLTHRQIDSRLDVVEATVQEAIGLMLEDRSANWEYMDNDLFGRKDWDFRRLAAENAKLRRDLEEIKKKQE